MTLFFSTVDIRGFDVICTEERWYDHILFEHPEMENEQESVSAAITNPAPFPCVYRDRDYPERHIYYRISDSREYYIKVIVDFSNPDRGEVITAFQPDSPKSGEILIWPESSD